MRRQTKTLERIIPTDVPPGILALHLKRYRFACKYVAGKRVLDMACGVGYGSFHMAEVSMQVVGVDIDRETVDYARQHYSGSDNLTFVQADAMRVGLADSQFDAVCSFETIEHIPKVEVFLSEVKRLLRPDGVFIVSTPRVKRSDSRPDNPYHYKEWSPTDFHHLLCGCFNNVEMFGQFRRETSAARWLKRLDVLKLRTWFFPHLITSWTAEVAGVRAMADLRVEDVLIKRGDLRHASEIVAVARDAH